MGICASCLGLSRHSQADQSDTSHLLNDSYQQPYGTINAPHSPQIDPEEIRRQRDALERLCVLTSDQLIDVSQAPAVQENETGRTDYARLFRERFPPVAAAPLPPPALSSDGRPSSSDNVEAPEIDEQTWLRQIVGSKASETGPWDLVEQEDNGNLTTSFDEALNLGRALER